MMPSSRNSDIDDPGASSSNDPAGQRRPLLEATNAQDEDAQDNWEVEWDVYSSATSANGSDGSLSSLSEAGSELGLFRRDGERLEGRRRVVVAGVLMAVTVLTLVAQTECTVYTQRTLGWDKPYLILYLTHSFYIVLWPGLIAYERFRQRDKPWSRFFEDHFFVVRRTAQYVMYRTMDLTAEQTAESPLRYMLQTCFVQCCALNTAAVTWFVAADMTTPSDLNAINNTSAIFTYVFSVWLLKEPMRVKKNIAVILAVVGVGIIAYGNPNDTAADKPAASYPDRTIGNMITGVGAVLFGLYRVLYKLKACLPAEASAEMNIMFSVIVGSSIGFFTTTVFWVPLPVLHFFGWEVFELPGFAAAFWTGVGMVCGVLFTMAFLSLTALTSPVLSSVAAMLSIFFVALYDWLFADSRLTGATLSGGTSIIVAFLLIGWSTYEETYPRDREQGLELERIPSREEV
ncbi:hypothetical protein Dda_7249 [Drechslerella dactyloides]|uniref:EamA domain-containing protein n=1 Tax=Drechslerella dactyloides TaxID=74499 RepID=A0AAD6IT18_DREDA|nr:hypothetical protein Dda_7249 [Drechslerella dactyloides]